MRLRKLSPEQRGRNQRFETDRLLRDSDLSQETTHIGRFVIAPLVAEQRSRTNHVLRILWECQAAGISPGDHSEAIYAEAERRRLCSETLDLPQLSFRELNGDLGDIASFANPEAASNPNLAYQAALLAVGK